MPSKAKFTKQQIAQAGLDIVRCEGIENLTARAIGSRLGCSACPIFTVFENMEQVQTEVRKFAKAIYLEYVDKGLSEELAFKGAGTQYILFAIREPKLFQLLFMSEQTQKPTVEKVLPVIDDSYEAILLSAQNGYELTQGQAERLYRHLWIYTHGIAVLCATNMCVFTPAEIEVMVSEAFRGILKEIKGEAEK